MRMHLLLGKRSDRSGAQDRGCCRSDIWPKPAGALQDDRGRRLIGTCPKLLREIQDARNIGAAKTIDGLVGITNDNQAGARANQRLE